MKKKWMIDQTVRHAIEETWAVFSNATDTPNPALFLARVADLARSNAFLWTEAGLQVQERTTRMVPVGQSLSRSLVLATVAADIFVGYTSLRERATWLSSLVQPRDWQLQHQRSANRVLETAASLGGVHRARLHDGRQVAVKVQYPDITNLVATDLAVLEQIVDYLQETLPLELDFEHEAASMSSLRTALAHRDDVLVPAVVPDLCTERLLVMEYIDGIKITDREALEQAGISPHEVARLLNDLYADQMLHLGILHADPHPGNLLVQPGPRLVLLDHGLTLPLAPSLVDALRKMVQSLTSGDFDGVTTALAEAGLQLDGQVDITSLLQLVGVLLGNGQTSETDETAGDVDAVEVGMQIGKSIGSIPTDLLLVGRTLGLLDGITKQLDPNMDTMEIIAHYT